MKCPICLLAMTYDEDEDIYKCILCYYEECDDLDEISLDNEDEDEDIEDE